MSTTDRPVGVLLRGEVAIPLGVLQFAWGLEDRGVRITIDHRGMVLESGRLIAPDEVAFAREHKVDLCRLVRYCDQQVAGAS